MMRIRHWSPRRAYLIAATWPASLLIAAAGILGAGHIYGWWVAQQSDGTASYEFRFRVINWPALILVLIGPSIALLLLWRILRHLDAQPSPGH